MRARSWLYACAPLDGLEIPLFMKCMNLKVCTDILYLQYTSIGAIPVPVLDLDILVLWAAEFVLWV